MQDARFFQTTRGRIVTALRRRHGASAVDLADEFGLSTNAIRQQLLFLERDGYVVERSVKRGPTKPTLEYSLTPSADSLFPQRYDVMLNAVLTELKTSLGKGAVDQLVAGLGKRAVERFGERMRSPDARGRASELAAILREKGVDADLIELDDGRIELREHNCPYLNTVAEHPEVCAIIHSVLRENVSPETTQVESIATGGDACRFEVKVS